MFVAVHDFLRANRRRAATILAIVTVAGAVTVAHSVHAGDHGHHSGAGDVTHVVLMCLAVAETAALGAAVLVVAKAPPALLRVVRAPIADIGVAGGFKLQPRPVARAGPASLQVFRR
jgi:hypothetical protein